MGFALLAATTVVFSGLGVASPVRATSATGGVVLDLYGGLHPFGGATVDTTGAPYWSGWDIARSVVVLPAGLGGWTLDGYGGIHNWGAAPAITTPVYWSGWDIARALVVLPDNQSGYLLDGYGGVHAFGPNAPASAFAGSSYWPGWDIARGIEVATDSNGVATGGWVMDGYGGVHSVGSVPSVGGLPAYHLGRDVWQKMHVATGGLLYSVGRWGVLGGASVSPNWSGYSDWGSWNATRDVVLLSPSGGSGAQPVSTAAQTAFAHATATGGAVLDLYGGIHPFGGATVDTTGAPYWPGFDIARSVVVLPAGSGGWTLDGYGGIHNWGTAPAITTPVYWSGWDIARALVVLPDNQSGYLLDGYGGVHAFGPNAPASAFAGSSYWPGWDIARGIEVATDSNGVATGGWVMDGYGGVHSVGSVPSVGGLPAYHLGRDVWQKMHVATGGLLYSVGRWGVLGGASVSPNWSGYSDWGSWNATRDVVLLAPSGGSGAQPVSAAALMAFVVASSDGVTAKPGCGAAGLVPPAGKWIVLSLECQELTAYQDGRVVQDTLITSGRPALATDRGHTHVLSKSHPFLMISPWPKGSPYYYSPDWVQYATWIWPNGTAIHDADWQPDSTLGPGSPNGPYASHGCVHVTLAMAAWVWSWADVGTPVDVV